MARNNYSRFRSVIKNREMNNKFIAVVFISISLFIIIFTVMDSKESRKLKTKILDYGSYFVYSFSAPIKTISLSYQNIKDIYNVYNENKKLKDDVSRIEMLENELISLKHENNLLKNTLNIKNTLYFDYQTAKVLVGIRSSFLKTLVILSGYDDQIYEGFPVISNNDLLGYIYESGKLTSRVLLITDINSRIPVTVLNKNSRIILSGNNSNYLDILNLGDVNNIRTGDELVTSGDGGVYPQGIPVGKIIKISNNKLMVRPNFYSRNLDYVRVLNWSPKEIANMPIQEVDELSVFNE